jgi:transcriptional regulator of acetoin/glycerol metabolism
MFREDLYYRVSSSTVILPPLRERREEIPWLVQLALETTAPGLQAKAALIEACMTRPWPGNVRELIGAIRAAARLARRRSLGKLAPDLLAPEAGLAHETPGPPSSRRKPVRADQVVRALRECPTVTEAARRLGIHRSYLYRLIRQFGLDVRAPPS